jgi:hypothetical protein
MSTVNSSSGRRFRRSVDSATAQAAGDGVRRGPYLLVLLLLSLFAWAPLVYPGFMQVHSGFLTVFNLADLAVVSNKLSWLPAIGVTPDLLRGEGPLAYWLALLLRPLAGDVGAIKAIFALSIIASGLGVYAWTRRVFSDLDHELTQRTGLLAAAVAMLWPPLLVTVYVRGALGEVLFIALVTWALWAVAGARRHVSRFTFHVLRFTFHVSRFTYVVAVALLTAALFWTQAGLALWATALLLVWALWPGAPLRSRGIAVAAVLVGALLGGGLFWLLHGGQDPASEPLDVAAHAVYLYQLLSPAWGFGVSTSGWQDDLSLQLGLAALGLTALTVVLGFGKLNRSQSAEADHNPLFTVPALQFAALSALVLILLTTTVARPLWRIEPLAATLTYPWQLFALVGPLLALLGGALLVVERRLAVLPVWAAAVALVVLSSYPYLAPHFTQMTPDPAAPAILGANQVTLVSATIDETGMVDVWEPSEQHALTVSQRFTVNLAWQALQPIDFDYNVFIHAEDADGNRVAQWDGQPTRGGEPYPMTAWTVGEIIVNDYLLELDPAAAPVQRVYLGLYNWQTGERLSVNGDDKVTLEVQP